MSLETPVKKITRKSIKVSTQIYDHLNKAKGDLSFNAYLEVLIKKSMEFDNLYNEYMLLKESVNPK